MTVGECRDLVAVAAASHGAPPAAVCARSIVEEEPAVAVGADSQRGRGAFGDDFRRGPRDGRQEPVEAFLAGNEFKAPLAVIEGKFIVPFGDAEDFVNRADAVARDGYTPNQGSERFLKRSVQGLGFDEQRVGVLGIDLGE